MRPILFHLGDVPVFSFWIAATVAFLAALLVVRAEILRRGYGAGLAYDLVLLAYIGGWSGARISMLPIAWESWVASPRHFLLSANGWSWYGGVIGGSTAAWLLARARRIPFLVLADVAAPGLAMGLAIGRIGCHLAGDGDYGVPTGLPWGMSYPFGAVPTNDRVHPAPLYEMLSCLAIFAYLWKERHHDMPPGQLFGRYLVLSGAARFAVEFVRRNPPWLIGLTTPQWMSLAAAGLGIILCSAKPGPRRAPHRGRSHAPRAGQRKP